MIDWSRGTKEDTALIGKIAKRAVKELGVSQGDVCMDLLACHTHGNPLDLAALMAAECSDFAHDICGINRHLNRDTGELKDCFSPRHSAGSRFEQTTVAAMEDLVAAAELAGWDCTDNAQVLDSARQALQELRR